jgi:uncharacterized protein (DUF433 family)
MPATTSLDWRVHIHSDPAVLEGKPVVRNSRLSVEFLLGLFAGGWRFEEEVLDSYPRLSPEAIRAVFAFAAESMRERSFYTAALLPDEVARRLQ